MCTSFLATEVVDALRDLDLIGLPRLVRLNPAVPWKTRGNGALCLQFGRGQGPARLVGVIRDHPIFSYPRMRAPRSRRGLGPMLQIAPFLVPHRRGCQPRACRLSQEAFARFYWQGVRDIIEKEDVVQELEGSERGTCSWRVVGDHRSHRGMAWRPRDRTFEIITYRERVRWGSEREIDLLREADGRAVP